MTSISDVKPFLKWVGGKTQLLPEIELRLPKTFSTYYEPFVGGGAVYFNLAHRIQTAHLSDVNADLINVYSVVKESSKELLQELSHHKNTEEHFYNLRNADRQPEYVYWTPVQKAARFIFLNKTCFNGLYRVNSKGEFNTPFGKYSNPNLCDQLTIEACSSVLNQTNTTFGAHGYADIVNMVKSKEDPSSIFVYFDPPYVPLTKTSNFVSYSKGGFGEAEHIELASVYTTLSTMGVKCMLSNSSTPLVFDLYKNYTIHTVSAKRNIACTTQGRRSVLEVLVTNY